jgi:ketosteroid isomerase-like protein
MSAEENTLVVKDAYAKFGQNDIPGLLKLLSDDVDWQAVVGASPAVPTSGRRQGRDAVAKFFTDLAGAITFNKFEPREFIAQNDKVVALGYYDGKSITTGRGMKSDWVMVFTVRDGKIVQFREFADVAAINAAFA